MKADEAQRNLIQSGLQQVSQTYQQQQRQKQLQEMDREKLNAILARIPKGRRGAILDILRNETNVNI
jgi:hypothetical protein